MEFCKKLCKKWIFFQNNSVENSLICPRTKSASHCLTELFPIYQNNIGPSDGKAIISSSNRPTVIYLRLTDFKGTPRFLGVTQRLQMLAATQARWAIRCHIVAAL